MTSKPEFDSLRGPPSLVHSFTFWLIRKPTIVCLSPKPHYEKGEGLGSYWLWWRRTKIHWFWFWILRTRSKPGLNFKTQTLFIVKELDLSVDSWFYIYLRYNWCFWHFSAEYLLFKKIEVKQFQISFFGISII